MIVVVSILVGMFPAASFPEHSSLGKHGIVRTTQFTIFSSIGDHLEGVCGFGRSLESSVFSDALLAILFVLRPSLRSRLALVYVTIWADRATSCGILHLWVDPLPICILLGAWSESCHPTLFRTEDSITLLFPSIVQSVLRDVVNPCSCLSHRVDVFQQKRYVQFSLMVLRGVDI